ncbi:hypothetical protein [Microcoleus sp. S13_C3]
MHGNYVTFFITVWNSIGQRQRVGTSHRLVSQGLQAIAQENSFRQLQI